MAEEVWTCWRNASHTINETIYGWPICFDCGAGPAYHERSQQVRDDFALGIYVPVGPIRAVIHEGSGIVGLHNGGDGDDSRTQIYYEGWVNGAYQYEDLGVRGRWEAAIRTAADRLVTQYPTIARADAREGELDCIGLYYPKSQRIIVDDPSTLERWLSQ